MHPSDRSSRGAAAAALLMLALAGSGCGSDSGSPGAPGPTAAGGNVNKAPVAGAAVSVHALGAGGAPGASVAGPFTTDANGDWSGSLPAGAGGPFVLAARGGSYVDEATAGTVTIPPGRALYGLLAGAQSSVTPLTHATYLGMQAQVAGGAAIADAIAGAHASSVNAFGFSFATTVPRNLATASDAEKTYAALLGGLSALIDNHAALGAFANTEKADLVIALARDMSDGLLDGLDAAGAIDVPTDSAGTATAPLPALSAADLSALMNAANAWAATQPALTGIAVLPGVPWNPAAPPPGPCVLQFSGPGAALLPSNCFNVTSSGFQSGNQPVWRDEVDAVEILLVPTDGDPNSYRTIYVLQTEPPNSIWNVSVQGAIAGIARNGDGSVTFTDVTVPVLTATQGPIVLNGTLPAP